MVDRYIIHYDGRGEEKHPHGDFVYWPDYQELERKLKEAEKERDAVLNMHLPKATTEALHALKTSQEAGTEALKRSWEAEAKVRELEDEVVFGFYEGEYPVFAQGYSRGVNELSSPVTAIECTHYVAHIRRLKEAAERVLKWVRPIAGDNRDDKASAEEELSVSLLEDAINRTKENRNV